MQETPPQITAPVTERLLDSREQFLRYIRGRIADPELAEDILQDSLLRALRAAPELRDTERLVPWFYGILRNAIVDAYRRRAVERKHLAEGAHVEPLAAADDEAEATRANLPAAADDEAEAAICACFRALIPTLKPEYADMIESLDLGGETPNQAAQRLGITPNNLKVRRHRARQALRQRLEETCRTCAAHHCLDCTCERG